MKPLSALLLSMHLFALESVDVEKKYSTQEVPQNLSVTEKKERFYHLLLPPIYKVHDALMQQFVQITSDIDSGKNRVTIEALKKEYKVQTDRELLLALKPHPVSIALAQAAMESAWATSRFFREANNAFGMWSVNRDDKRIAAAEKRGGKRTIWLRKFATLEDSVSAYYKTMGRAKIYAKFREYRYETNNVFKIIQGLDRYSERGEAYVKELASMIRYNKLTRYDKERK